MVQTEQVTQFKQEAPVLHTKSIYQKMFTLMGVLSLVASSVGCNLLQRQATFKLGTETLGDFTDQSDFQNFYIGILACFESVNPDRDCQDETDLPISDLPTTVELGKTGQTYILTTNKEGLAEFSVPYLEAADTIELLPDGGTNIKYYVRTILPSKIPLTDHQGREIIVCQEDVFGLGVNYQHHILPFSVERCGIPDSLQL